MGEAEAGHGAVGVEGWVGGVEVEAKAGERLERKGGGGWGDMGRELGVRLGVERVGAGVFAFLEVAVAFLAEELRFGHGGFGLLRLSLGIEWKVWKGIGR